MIRFSKIIIVIFFSSLAMFSCNQGHERKKPNVLFISVDDLNDWIEPLHAHNQVLTPNLNKLTHEGLLFTNAHCTQAVCTASRNSVLSGIHPSTSGWYHSPNEYAANYDKVMSRHQMLPEFFKTNGYNTFVVGKIFHQGATDFPDKVNDFWTECAPEFWDENKMEPHIKESGKGYGGWKFYPFPKDGGRLYQYVMNNDTIKHIKNTGHSLCGGPLEADEIPKNGMYDEQIAKWGIEKMKEDHNEPFFLAVGFVRPHVPYTAPQEYFDLYNSDNLKVPEVPDDEMSDIPVFGKSVAYGARTPRGGWYDVNQIPGYRKELVHSYLACVSFVDEQIGRLINGLKESGHWDDTIIVLWSDHGQHFGEKKHYRKQALWEESTKVPLYFRIPNIENSGRIKQVVSLLDIYPTLTQLCNLPIQNKLEGKSLVPLLENTDLVWERPVLSCWYYNNYSVRSNNWRYIRYRSGSEELYNHEIDPGEHNNLALDTKYDSIISEHKKWIPRNGALPAGHDVWDGDKLDRTIKLWEENDSIPTWLR